jgi:uncharacterized damage-inducible protein DinB
MITNQSLIWNFDRNVSVYAKPYLSDLTHSDSLVQPPVQGNCINWIVGHIVSYRNVLLKVCGLSPVVSDDVEIRYARGSQPVLADAPDVAKFENIVQAYWQAHERLMSFIDTMTAEQAGEMVSAVGFNFARSELMTLFMRHESYHLGQIEWLRVWVLSKRK